MKTDLSYKDFEILESIRGIAALYVVVAHARGVLWMGGKIFLEQKPISSWDGLDFFIFGSSMSTRLAVEFVIIFFVLSGFSIAHSISKSQSIREFYLKRIIRLYPPYLFAIIWASMVFLITYLIKPEFYNTSYDSLVFERYRSMLQYLSIENTSKALFYLPPMKGFIVQFWSLSYEVIFYILAPIIFTVNRSVYNFLSVTLFLIYLLFFETLQLIAFENLIFKYFLIYNFFFFLGSTLYQKFDWVIEKTKALSKNRFLIIIFGLLALTYAINIILRKESVWSYLPASLLGISLIIFFLKYKVRIISMIKIGRYSYTLYITHVASLFLYHTLYYIIVPNETLPYITNYFVFIPAIFSSLVIAYLQYMFVEKRTKVILNRFRKSQ